MSWPAMRDAENEAAVLARNEARRHRHEQVDGADEHRERDDHRGEPMAQDFPQRVVVGAGQRVETAFERAIEPPCFR